MTYWGFRGEEIVTGGRGGTLGPGIRGDEILDCMGFGIEGVEVDAQGSELSAAEPRVEVGGGVGFNDGLVGEVEAFGLRVFVWWEKVTGVRNVALGPTNFVHLGQVFDEVGVGVELACDLTEIDDGGAGKILPAFFDDGVGDVGRTDH